MSKQRQHPDRDSLSAYLEEALSIDATQWVEQHLEKCGDCRAKLDQERAFLDSLHGLGRINPPADFVEGVMARVAQYPAYQPAKEVAWSRVALWTGAAAALVVVVLGVIGWVLVTQRPLDNPETSGAVSVAIVKVMEASKELYRFAESNMGGVMYVLQIAGTLLVGLFDFVRNSSLVFQLALLLITVGLNYLLTRMVLNYQRRH